MASGPIATWQMKGKGGSSDKFPLPRVQNLCGWWLQPWNQKTVASWQESDDKRRQCVEKQRYHSANKGPYSQSCGFSNSHMWMWELDHKEGWVPKKWCFEMWCWRKFLNVPWHSMNQSLLKEISPECSSEWLMLKLTLQPFGHLMRRVNSLEKPLLLGKIEGGRRRGWQWLRWLDGITNSMDMSLSKLWEMVKDREASLLVLQSLGPQSLTQRSDWTTT